MPYSASPLQLHIRFMLGIWGKCKESKRKEEAQGVKRKTGCEKGGSELLRKRWSNRKRRKSAPVRNSLGVRKAVTIGVSVFGGEDCRKESFGEWIDGVENCYSKELQSSLG